MRRSHAEGTAGTVAIYGGLVVESRAHERRRVDATLASVSGVINTIRTQLGNTVPAPLTYGEHMDAEASALAGLVGSARGGWAGRRRPLSGLARSHRFRCALSSKTGWGGRDNRLQRPPHQAAASLRACRVHGIDSIRSSSRCRARRPRW